MKTNGTIFAEIKAAGFMTEKQMQLLKNRSNKAQKDLLDYDTLTPDGGIPMAPEWSAKGIQWLRSLLTKKGEPRKGQNLGFREIEIIKTANPEDIRFNYFYDNGRGWYRNFVPVYYINGMEYFVEGRNIKVIG